MFAHLTPPIEATTPDAMFLDLAREMSGGAEVDTGRMLLILALAGKTPDDLHRLCEQIATENDARYGVLSRMGDAIPMPTM